jgi:peptidoglycan hydrolase CwlO-like protein
MKKYIIIIILWFLLVSCEETTKHKVKAEDAPIEYADTKKVDSLLEMVDGFKISVDEVIYERNSLDEKLILVKEELATTKDSLAVANERIKEYKYPKKRSFFDKVLGKNKDSITVIDTIK